MRQSRLRQKAKVQQLQKIVDNLTAGNCHPEMEFNKRIGKKRGVVVFDERDASQDVWGQVTGFLPGGRVSVMTQDGRVVVATLDQVLPDHGYFDVEGWTTKKLAIRHKRC
jgi:hypothetical protein